MADTKSELLEIETLLEENLKEFKQIEEEYKLAKEKLARNEQVDVTLIEKKYADCFEKLKKINERARKLKQSK